MARPAAVPATARGPALKRRDFAAAAAALATFGSGAAATAQSATTLRLASNAADDVTPVLWANHTGAFAKAGLNVEITRMNSGAAVTAAVIGGTLEIGKSSVMPLISAHRRNLPISIIAPGELWVTAAPITGLVVPNMSPIKTAKDLIGKTIATAALHDTLWLGTNAWLDQHGGDSRTVRFVEVPPSAMLGAVLEGRVDAATMTNPLYAAAMASGKVRAIGYPTDGIAKRFLITSWFATNDYIAHNRETVAHYAEIVEQTAAYTNAHPSETIAMIADFSGVEPAALARMTRGLCGTRLDPRDIQPVIDAAAKYGLIDQRFDARDILAKV